MSHDNTWQDQITRGRLLVSEISDRKWELGDLANEVCPAGQSGVSNGEVLGRFAAEIGVGVETLRTYRLVSSSWASAERSALQTWHTHKTLAARPDRAQIIAEQTWTYNSLSERLGRLPNPSRVSEPADHVPPYWPASSAPVAIAAALGSEAASRSLIESRETRRLVRDAILSNPKVAIEARKALDQTYADSPKPIPAPKLTPTDEGLDLVSEFHSLHKSVDKIVRMVNEGKAVVSDSTRDAILREVKWLRTALGYVEDGVSSDSLEQEIASFLETQR